MTRKSARIKFNPDNPIDQEINKFLDQQSDITGTIKLLLRKARSEIGDRDLREAINNSFVNGEKFTIFSGTSVMEHSDDQISRNKGNEKPDKPAKQEATQNNKKKFDHFFPNNMNYKNL